MFALYPRITQLDFTGPYEVLFTGPYEVLARLPNARCILASARDAAITADGGITFSNVQPLASVSSAAVLCVPGGFGTIAAMADAEYLAQVRRLAEGARYITSVCTGSLLLGAAGLLRGKRAACHWAWRELLAHFCATPDPARVVRDGNVFTGGGVTAGIDMALTLMAEIAGDAYAQTVQLGIEYAPAPPFDCGRPELAGDGIVSGVRARLNALGAEREAAVLRAAARLDRSQSN